MAFHISLLTSIYALMQLIFAPFWGQWSDRIGRRPLVLIGIAGSVVTQILFGIVNSLWMLYVVRAVGGFLTSAMLPAATAYVADVTTEDERNRGMAWLGTAVSLSVVVGPALGGLATRKELHFMIRSQHVKLDSFSLPFFIAAALASLAFLAATRWLPESLPLRSAMTPQSRIANGWQNTSSSMRQLLGLGYGPVNIGISFMVCGLVMAIFQVVAVGYLAKRIGEMSQIALGFGLMGSGIALLLIVRTFPTVLGAIGLLAFGMAFITPNIAALISERGGRHTGSVLGLQSAANSLGQVGGPLFGGFLFGWHAEIPYLFAGVFLVSVGLVIGWKESHKQTH